MKTTTKKKEEPRERENVRKEKKGETRKKEENKVKERREKSKTGTELCDDLNHEMRIENVTKSKTITIRISVT